MIFEEDIIKTLNLKGVNNVYKQGDNYSFDHPSYFIACSHNAEKINSFSYKMNIEVLFVYRNFSEFMDMMDKLKSIIKKHTILCTYYIYDIKIEWENEEKLTNGYFMRKATYILTIEEVK